MREKSCMALFLPQQNTYSAECGATLLAMSYFTLQQNILLSTWAEYCAGDKYARCGLVLQWFAPSIQ